MSFPNIPDITPKIDISFEDSINLILTSIAMEEMSLSRLLDAEKCKICYVLDDCRGKDSLLHNAIAIDKSVNETVQNIIKLQMLLQFKLENVKDLLPCTTTTYSTTTTSTTTTTTCTRTSTHTTTTTTTCTRTSTHTTTCSSSVCPSTTQVPCCSCCLKGKGLGYVSDKSDHFYCKPSVLQAFIYGSGPDNRSIRYTVGDKCDNLTVSASKYDITVKCPDCLCNDCMMIIGRCNVERRFIDCPYEAGSALLRLTVKKLPYGKLGFTIEITSKCNPRLTHSSGFVLVNVYDSDLVMRP